MGRRPRAAAGARRLPGPTCGGRRRGRARPCGGAQLGSTPHGKAQSAAPTSRRLHFSVTSLPGRRRAQPPASLRGTMENGSTGQMRSSNPPPGWRGVCAKARRSRPSGPTARKDAVVATRVTLGDTSVSATMGCLRRRWSPASAGHPQHTKRRSDVRSMRLSGSFLSAYFGCPSRTLPLRCE